MSWKVEGQLSGDKLAVQLLMSVLPLLNRETSCTV